MTEAVVGRRCLTSFLTGLVLAVTPLSAAAKGNCDAQGGLFYLGNIKDDTRSIWLSATSPGSFNSMQPRATRRWTSGARAIGA